MLPPERHPLNPGQINLPAHESNENRTGQATSSLKFASDQPHWYINSSQFPRQSSTAPVQVSPGQNCVEGLNEPEGS